MAAKEALDRLDKILDDYMFNGITEVGGIELNDYIKMDLIGVWGAIANDRLPYYGIIENSPVHRILDICGIETVESNPNSCGIGDGWLKII